MISLFKKSYIFLALFFITILYLVFLLIYLFKEDNSSAILKKQEFVKTTTINDVSLFNESYKTRFKSRVTKFTQKPYSSSLLPLGYESYIISQ